MKMTRLKKYLILGVIPAAILSLGMNDLSAYASEQTEEINTDTDPDPDKDEEKKEIVTGWVKKKDQWFFFDKDGAPHTGWLDHKKNRYFMDEQGQMCTGWISDNGRWYYMDQEGRLTTGWVKSKEKWYFLDQKSGVMQTGWLKDGDTWYFLRDDGSMKKGWLNRKDKWYFLDSTGAMKTGWKKYDGQWYHLKSDGAMNVGWGYIGKKWYFFDTDGAQKTGFIESKDKKYYTYENGGYAKDGWLVKEGHSYHFDSDGVLDKDSTKAEALVSMPGYYISPMYAGQLNTPEERIEAMIKRAYEYKNAGTTYSICKSQEPGRYADCSGLVMQCLYAAGFDPAPATPKHHALPENEYDSRTLWSSVPMKHINVSKDGSKYTEKGNVDYSKLRRGDLIYYKSPNADIINHVAIYLGDDKVIEAVAPYVMDWLGLIHEVHGTIYGVTRPFE